LAQPIFVSVSTAKIGTKRNIAFSSATELWNRLARSCRTYQYEVAAQAGEMRLGVR
jgi:hypothetical protein